MQPIGWGASCSEIIRGMGPPGKPPVPEAEMHLQKSPRWYQQQPWWEGNLLCACGLPQSIAACTAPSLGASQHRTEWSVYLKGL